MTISKRIILLITILLTCVSCDQGTKSVAESYLSKAEIWSYLGDTVRLQLAHNTGAFLSLGSSLSEPWRAGLFSAGVALLLLVLMSYILINRSLTSMEIIALALMFAGGLSNLIDRVSFGYVIDFINVGIDSLRTGVFNVADMAVSSGVMLLLVGMVLPKAKSD